MQRDGGRQINDVKRAGAQGEMQSVVGKTISMHSCTKVVFKFKSNYKDHLHTMSDPPKPCAENLFAVYTHNSELFQILGGKKKKLMKFEMFSSGHPSAQAELFTCWTLHIPVPQASDTAERLSFGSCTTKTWKRKPIRENIYIFNHATMYFRVPVSNFLILGGEKVFFMMNENRFGFCVLLDDSFSWKWMRKIIPDWSKCSLLPKL